MSSLRSQGSSEGQPPLFTLTAWGEYSCSYCYLHLPVHINTAYSVLKEKQNFPRLNKTLPLSAASQNM